MYGPLMKSADQYAQPSDEDSESTDAAEMIAAFLNTTGGYGRRATRLVCGTVRASNWNLPSHLRKRSYNH